MDPFFQQMMQDMQFGRTNDGQLEKYTNKDFLIQDQEQCHVPDHVHQFGFGFGFDTSSYELKLLGMNRNVAPGSRNGYQSKANLSPTHRVDIKVLMENVDATLNGRYFLCRCITPPNNMVSIMTVVDDPEGKRAVRLALYNYTSVNANFEQVLPVGLILAIKNPWFKSAADGGLIVRCENPADVIIVNSETLAKSFPNLVWKGEIPIKYRSRALPGSSSDGCRRNDDGLHDDLVEPNYFHHLPVAGPLLRSIPTPMKPSSNVVVHELSKEDEVKVDNLKRTGNQSFIDKDFVNAIRFYTQALEISTMNIDLLSTRAASFINLGCYNKALLDIKKVLDQDPFHIKGIYRQVKSLWGLQRYKEAVDFVNMKFGQNSALKKVKELRLLNQKTLELQEQHETGSFDMVEILKDPTKTSEIAEFTGPVQISKIPGKGRGLIATETVKPGQLLLCNKAFAFYSLDSNADETFFEAMISPGHDDVVASIVQKLTLEPELGREFFQLFAGPELGAVSEDDEATEEIDMKRIDQIVTFNRFSVKGQGMGREATSTKGTGLWIMPSYCNHSCTDANSYWEIFGTFMFIRTVRPIQKGEEILISYVSQHLDYNQREEVFQSHAFMCDCLRCNLEREEGEVIRSLRSDIIKSLEIKKIKMTSDLTSALEGFSKLESLQQKQSKMNLSLAHPVVLDIGLQLFDLGDYERCLELLKKAHYVSRDTAMARHAVYLSCNILGCYLHDRSTHVKVVKKWVKNLKHDLMVAFGSLKPVHVIGPKTLKLLQSTGLGINFFQE